MGSQWSKLGSERPVLGSGRPDLRSEKPDLRSERSDLGSERLYLRLGGDGRTETVENCPMWNHRSSAPPWPPRCPKKESLFSLVFFSCLASPASHSQIP